MRLIILFLFTLCWRTTLFGQTERPSIFGQMGIEEGAKVTLVTDLTTVLAQKKTATYFPGTLTTPDGKTFAVQLRASGKFRRMKAAIPPLKVKFKKKELSAQGLDTLNKVKLIMPWFESPRGEELLVKEYLCYRMFEPLSDLHVRARLVRLTLQHTNGSQKRMPAILLEDDSETAARYQAYNVKRYGIKPDSLEAHQAALTVLYQYLVGNTDWDLQAVRNVRIIQHRENGTLWTMPYDFDFSGMVAAPYASPSSESGLKSVRDRFLMPQGINPEALKKAVAVINKRKGTLYAICEASCLSPDGQKDMKRYLDVYFKKMGQKELPPEIMRD